MNKDEYLKTLKQYESVNDVVMSANSLSERVCTELDGYCRDLDEKLIEYEKVHKIKTRPQSGSVKPMVIKHTKGHYVFQALCVILIVCALLLGSMLSSFSMASLLYTPAEEGISYDDYLQTLPDSLYEETEEATGE